MTYFDNEFFHTVLILTIAFILLTVFLVFALINTSDINFISILIVSSLVWIILLMIHNYFFSLPFSGNDDIRFEQLSLNFYYSWIYDLSLNIFQNSYFYSMILGMLYFIFGYNEILPGLFNLTFYVFSIFIVYKIYLLVFQNKKGVYLCLLLCGFSIVNIIFSVITLREIQVTFFILMMLFLSLKFAKTKNNKYVIYYIATCLVGSQFHVGLIAFIVFIGLQYYLLNKGTSKIFFTMIILSVFIGVISLSDDTKIDSVLDDDNVSYEQSGADYTIPIGDSILNPLYSVIKVLYFLLKPFPWEISNFNGIVGILLNIFIIVMLINIYKYYRETNDKYILTTFLFIITCLIIFGLGTSNYGTGFRHKHKFIFILIMFIPPLIVFKEYYKGGLIKNVSNLKTNRKGN
ncbi:hypothetical protein [Jeotgalicoccus sp. S0W5]|uniref:hypothetical protein n=1 Tax=Jeotgalicoccus sp. S0W5 TaxID=2527874 RepID=UPI001414F837|nr:hypothetical protein [Jeotgalicoccus sp. S0W5]